MNKAQLIDVVQQKLGGDISKRAAGDALDAVLAAIAQGVKEQERVQIIGFGTFKLARRGARPGRNPKTKEPVEIPPSKTVRFTPAAALKESM
jgi:DNA-binding protein HU-beta